MIQIVFDYYDFLRHNGLVERIINEMDSSYCEMNQNILGTAYCHI